jgi:hypothetical protein
MNGRRKDPHRDRQVMERTLRALRILNPSFRQCFWAGILHSRQPLACLNAGPDFEVR